MTRLCVLQVGMWFIAPGSPYNNLAYCERFPRGIPISSNSSTAGSDVQYWAQVGKPSASNSNFDNIGWALLTIFQMLTTENWNNVLYDGVRSTGPHAALFFIAVVVLGHYVVLNLFLAILLDNFGSDDESKQQEQQGQGQLAAEESVVSDGASMVESRPGSFLRPCGNQVSVPTSSLSLQNVPSFQRLCLLTSSLAHAHPAVPG
jgi:hypothetical protein